MSINAKQAGEPMTVIDKTEQVQEMPQASDETAQKAVVDLDSINASLGTISIKGKDYVPVNQRILGFRKLYPDGSITTEIIDDDGERCVVKATVANGDGNVLGTGHAFEVKAGRINQTSYLENCETSAVGRALGFVGIGATESIASADEVQNAVNMEPKPEPDKPVPNTQFVGRCRSCGKRYTFPAGTTEEAFRATPCCDRPDWVVE